MHEVRLSRSRKRVYFLDADGNDWEFVQYLAPEPARRHDYLLPDAYVPTGSRRL